MSMFTDHSKIQLEFNKEMIEKSKNIILSPKTTNALILRKIYYVFPEVEKLIIKHRNLSENKGSDEDNRICGGSRSQGKHEHCRQKASM